MLNGFKKFILRGNVVDLAVAVVIGAAFGSVVTSLVRDIITPILGVFGGIPDFSAWSFTVNSSTFGIGSFINAVLSFIVISSVVYFFVLTPVNRLMDLMKSGEPEGPKTRECPECLSKIPVAARRCAFCTTVLAADDAQTATAFAPGAVMQRDATVR
ncbi:MAG: large conductance mechanosensitive channel protein MscL [Chloroflexota bacterium]|nr:large conductance mechanosensitive channel protein MscL [Chloroflexota bacterium]